MTRRRPGIPARTRIFVGCEGESERSYFAMLMRRSNEVRLPVHLDVVPLYPGAGDPKARLVRARERIREQSERHGAYARSIVVMDTDQLATHGLDRVGLDRIAEEIGIGILWQEPNHEGFLLRHFVASAALRPPTGELALRHLKAEWPAYSKPMQAAELLDKLDLGDVRRAAASHADFDDFLKLVGLA